MEPWAPRPPRVAGHLSPLFLVGLVPHGKGREEHLPLALYKVEEGSPFSTQSHLIEISLSLSSSLPVWFPFFGAGTRGWGFLHHTHAVALLESGSESIFFRCSAGSEPGGTLHTPYACETTRCCTCGTTSLSGGLRREICNTARRP